MSHQHEFSKRPTSLIEVQVAVAEQELLVEESELPESFLLASNNADATSILDDVSQESKLCSCSQQRARRFCGSNTQSLRACPRCTLVSPRWPSFFDVGQTGADIKGCHTGPRVSTPRKFLRLSFSRAAAVVWSRARAALPPAAGLLLRSSCGGRGGPNPSCQEGWEGGGCYWWAGCTYETARSRFFPGVQFLRQSTLDAGE